MTNEQRKEFFINQINKAIEDVRGCDPTFEEYLRMDSSNTLHWSRNWGETLYDLAEEEGLVDWDDIDLDDVLCILDECETVAHAFHHYDADFLEEYFQQETESICGYVSVCGYKINAMEALRLCDPTAWREQFLAWLNEGELDVSAYEFVGED